LEKAKARDLISFQASGIGSGSSLNCRDYTENDPLFQSVCLGAD
jgi:hypothetical protein